MAKAATFAAALLLEGQAGGEVIGHVILPQEKVPVPCRICFSAALGNCSNMVLSPTSLLIFATWLDFPDIPD